MAVMRTMWLLITAAVGLSVLLRRTRKGYGLSPSLPPFLPSSLPLSFSFTAAIRDKERIRQLEDTSCRRFNLCRDEDDAAVDHGRRVC